MIGIEILEDDTSSATVMLTSLDPLYLAPSGMNGRCAEMLEPRGSGYNDEPSILNDCIESTDHQWLR